jgi:hypothetical protein
MMLDKIIKKIRNLTHEQQKQVLKYLDSIPKDGQRGYSRLPTKLEIDAVIDGDKVVQSDTLDISASGVYIKTDAKFELGQSARIVFSIPGHDIPLKLHGEITRIDKEGMAIRFDRVSSYLKEILDGAIWKDQGR